MAKTTAAANAEQHPELWAAVQTFEENLAARDAAAETRRQAHATAEAAAADEAKALEAEAAADTALRDALTNLGTVAAALVVQPAPVPPA